MAFMFGVLPMLLIAPLLIPLIPFMPLINSLFEFLNYIAPFIADL